MARPTAGFPDFAMNDVTDPSSGQPNVVEPSAGKKAGGFIYNEKPPRQYLNWMQRLNSLWIRYLDDGLTNVFSSFHHGSFQGKVAAPTAGDKIVTMDYVLLWDRVVVINFPGFSIQGGFRSTDDLRLIDVVDHEMPSFLKPPNYGIYFSVPYAINDAAIDVAVGFIDHDTPGTQLVFYKKDLTYFDKSKINTIPAFHTTYYVYPV